MEEKIERAINKLKKQRFLNKDRVIDELFKDANSNTGILETSCVISLKCPVSRTRIKTPIRFHHCKHAQCFDADSFFQLTLSSIVKKCPICNLQANYNSLVVDGLFYEILKHTSKTDEYVTLYSDGNWEVKKDNNHSTNNYKSGTYKSKTTSPSYQTNKPRNIEYNINYNSNNHHHHQPNIEINNHKINYSISKRPNNNKNIIYNYRIIDNGNNYETSESISSSSSSTSSSPIPKENYIEKTKKIFLDDLSCLKYDLHQASLHNEVINTITENQYKNDNNQDDNEINEDDYLDYLKNNDNIEDKMKTIQELTNTIQRILDDSNKTLQENKYNANNILNRNKIEDKNDNNNNNTKSTKSSSFKNISENTDDILKSTTSFELKNKIDAIEKEIENSRKKKQSLLERSEYISSKYKSKVTTTTTTTTPKTENRVEQSKKNNIPNTTKIAAAPNCTTHWNNRKNYTVRSRSSMTNGTTSTSLSSTKPTIIQIKTETVQQRDDKPKIVYYYKII